MNYQNLELRIYTPTGFTAYYDTVSGAWFHGLLGSAHKLPHPDNFSDCLATVVTVNGENYTILASHNNTYIKGIFNASGVNVTNTINENTEYQIVCNIAA